MNKNALITAYNTTGWITDEETDIKVEITNIDLHRNYSGDDFDAVTADIHINDRESEFFEFWNKDGLDETADSAWANGSDEDLDNVIESETGDYDGCDEYTAVVNKICQIIDIIVFNMIEQEAGQGDELQSLDTMCKIHTAHNTFTGWETLSSSAISGYSMEVHAMVPAGQDVDVLAAEFLPEYDFNSSIMHTNEDGSYEACVTYIIQEFTGFSELQSRQVIFLNEIQSGPSAA